MIIITESDCGIRKGWVSFEGMRYSVTILDDAVTELAPFDNLINLAHQRYSDDCDSIKARLQSEAYDLYIGGWGTGNNASRNDIAILLGCGGAALGANKLRGHR